MCGGALEYFENFSAVHLIKKNEGGGKFGDSRNAGREHAATLRTQGGRFYLAKEARSGKLTN